MAKWNKIERKGDIEDRRGLATTVGGIGLAGVALLAGVHLLLGGDPAQLLGLLNELPVSEQVGQPQQYEGNDEYEQFASSVLGSNNQAWEVQFEDSQVRYAEPTLVLFRQRTKSGCGYASSRMGPHYCSRDETIYLDETFFDELTRRFGARGGDVAEAYVIAHEVGHHVQYLTGILEQVQQLSRASDPRAQQAHINLELQADCYAGVWASTLRGRGILETGEIQEAMDAAAAAGDDRIQEAVTGDVNPETWTHGSSDQRVSWFNRGYEAGDMAVCDTFSSE